MLHHPQAQSNKIPSSLRVTTNGALIILSLVIGTTDAFPPLKSAASIALALAEAVKSFRSNKEAWADFGDLLLQRIAFLVDRLNGNHARLSPTLLADLETLSAQLLAIHKHVLRAQDRPKWKKMALIREDSSLLSNLKEELNDALSQFTLASHIDTRIHQQREDTPSLRVTSPTPPPALFFYGRNDYIVNLVQLIKVGQEKASARRMIINGPGGIGKTSIATALLHHPDMDALFSEHRYFASCEAAVSESLLLESIASSLSLNNGPRDLLQSIISFFRKVSHPAFLVLDNFETCWLSNQRREIHQVLKQLVALESVTLLLTMRGKDEPPEIRWERLPELTVLSLSDACQLFMDIAEIEPPLDPLVDELLQALDCLPLAITLLAQLMRQGETIETLHRRWAFQKTGLLSISTGSTDRLYSLDSSIKLSLESAPMKNDPSAARLLRVLSYLPNGIPSGSLERLDLLSMKEAYQASYTLRSVSLAYQDSNGTLRSLSPIRHHIAYYTPLEKNELKAIQEYYIGLAEMAEKAVNQELDIIQTARLLRPELGNLIAVLHNLAGSSNVDDRTSEAILQTSKFMYLKEAPSTDLLTHLLGNKNFYPTDYFKAECTYMIGMAHHISARNGQALKVLEEALSQFTTLDDQRRVASCESTIADLLGYQGKFSEAIAMFEKARRRYEDLGADDKPLNETAFCLLGLAGIADIRGDIEQAQSMLGEALSILTAEEYSVRAYCRMDLASIGIQRGKYQEAVNTLREILAECRVNENLHNVGNCLSRLCVALIYLGEYDQARVYAEEGQSIGEMQGLVDVSAHCTRVLGYVCLHQKAFLKAEELFVQAVSTFEQHSNRLGAADTNLAMAKLMLEKGERDEAERQLNAVLSEYRDMECLRGIAETQLALAKLFKTDTTRIDQAAESVQEASRIYKQASNSAEFETCLSLLASLQVSYP